MTDRSSLLAYVAALGVAAGGSGCGAFRPLSAELRDAIRDESAALAPSIDDHAGVEAFASEAAAGAVPEMESYPLAEDCGLEDLVRLALERHPRIQSMVRMLEALGMRVPQATSLADPTLMLMPPLGSMVETAGGQLDTSIGLTQSVPFPAKLGARGDIAEQVVRIALADLQAAKLEVVSELKRAYYGYYLSHVAIIVTREHQKLLASIREIADGKFRAGTAPQHDVLRAEVQLYELSNDLLTLEQERRIAAARINVLIDRAVDAELPVPAPFDATEIGWRVDALMARAVETSPDLRAIQEQVERDLAAVRLARMEYLPDFSVGATYGFIGSGISPVATGRDIWSFAFGVRIPLWLQRIRAGVLEKNASALASALQYRSRRNDVFFAIQDALVRVDTQHRRAVLIRDAILPRAAQTLEASESGYQAGQVEFLAWIDDWKRLLVLTLEYHEALASLEQGFAVLEELVGGALPRSESAGGDGRGTAVPERATEGPSDG